MRIFIYSLIIVFLTLNQELLNSSEPPEKASTSIEFNQLAFPPTAKVISKNQGCFQKEIIEDETALLSADINYALENGGPITRYFLTKFLEDPYLRDVYSGVIPGLHIIVDSRIHALKQGEYPGLPGWHTDFIERVSPTNMELDYSKFNPAVKIYIVNFSDHPKGVSNTEYLTDGVSLTLPEKHVYKSLNTQISSMPRINSRQVADGEILSMDQYSLHRISPAHQDGLRGFIRLAVFHDLTTTIFQDRAQNCTRNYVQTFLTMPGAISLKNSSQNQTLKKAYYFVPKIKSVDSDELTEIQRVLTVSEINKEPMLVNCDLDYALQVGGPITRKFIKAIQQQIEEKDLGKVKVNTRIHMLMKDQYSDIPLYTDVSLWRSGAPFAEIIHPGEKGVHFLLLLSSNENGVSEIEFCKEDHDLTMELSPSLDSMENLINGAAKATERLKDNKVVCFENGTLHRALPAHASGWRLSLLVSVDSSPAENKIVRQIYTYADGV